MLLCCPSATKGYPTSAHWHTITQTSEIPSTPSGLPGPRRLVVSLKSHQNATRHDVSAQRRNNAGNFSDDHTESCRVDALRGYYGGMRTELWLCLISERPYQFFFGLWQNCSYIHLEESRSMVHSKKIQRFQVFKTKLVWLHTGRQDHHQQHSTTERQHEAKHT